MPGKRAVPTVTGRARRWRRGKSTCTLSVWAWKAAKRSVIRRNFWRTAAKCSRPFKRDRMELPELVFADSGGQVACRNRSRGHLLWMSVGSDALPAENLCDRLERDAILLRGDVRFVIRNAP